MVDESKIKIWTVGNDTFVSDGEGNKYQLHGYGSMKDFVLEFDPRIDLTKPIWEQARRLDIKDRAAERKAKRESKAAAV